MYVCLCNGVTERQVRAQAAADGRCSVSSMHRALGVTTKCGKCIPMMRDILREFASPEPAEPAI